MAPPSNSSEQPQEAQMKTLTLSLTLIPTLPNDIAALILAFVPYSHHARLKSVSRSWKLWFSSKTLASFRHCHLPVSARSHLLCIFPQDPSVASPLLFDPKNLAWCPIPPMPCNPHVYGLCNFTSISIGHHLYVLGGSLFDTRSYPLDRPCPSAGAFRFDCVTWRWERLSPMISPRGSFACAAVPSLDKIVVAGGGSRHSMFGAAGSRMSSVEMYDILKDEWVALDGLPRFRAGCVGFSVGREFWVMGGYGDSRTISGVFPVDNYYRDAVVMELENGGQWREVGDMWEEGERGRLGKVVVVDNEGWYVPSVFMLDRNEIFRYNMASNSWLKETGLPRSISDDSAVGFVSLDGELYVITHLSITDSRRLRLHKRSTALLMQIYHPGKRLWRSFVTNPPFPHPLDFKTAVLCTVHL